ncbi:MAG: SUMF1/EgtB/PvdO family nonheme iron enzyme [Desmonostoc vinosum HA7617-LM4]|jgi:formylglycine-generating enzyme required for sulfatase activity/nucleoside-triphosphatase THEP1|nr:SUMF1/EgtB/PvdO family nonheme iron enzyme [Desmonostoc vinosum HA7617-LM4]
MVLSRVTEKVPISPGVKKVSEQDKSFSNQILILFSAPLLDENFLPVENLSIQEEIEAIASVLENVSHPIAVEIVVKVATSQTLQDVLSSRIKPLIIHFIGHGTKESDNTALVLEDEMGISRHFSEEELDIALSNQKQAPCQLVLLNACHSEKLAQAFIKAGVPHIIAVNAEDKILDIAARCFSRRLYQALFNEDAIADAFLVSRSAVKLDDKLKKVFNSQTFEKGVNFDEAFKFKLLPQAPHSQSLIIEPTKAHQIVYPQWLNTNIPRGDPKFVGRKQEIHRVIKVLVEPEKRCIALHGMGGIGKTALAYAIGQWLHERNCYKDGVWFISLRDTDSVGTMITKIQQTLELSSFDLKKELRNSRILLIFDDLDKLIEKETNELIEVLNSLIEQCSNLRLLLTARDSLVRDIDCHQEEVCSMGASETRQIFKKYAPSEAQWGNDDLASDFHLLVQFLDSYPLPIKLAASYMAETQCTLKMLCEDLKIEPLEILAAYSAEERKERSLQITLERSFEMLSVEGQDIFPLLAFFPSGLSRDLARAIAGRNGNKTLMELLKFSMVEKTSIASDWRVSIPEPARTYAESKLQKGRGIDYIAPLILDFYNSSFCNTVLELFGDGEEKRGQQLLLQENSNLILFLEWGYAQELNSDNICRSARITASLSHYWRWIEANQDPLSRLNSAIEAARRNQDQVGEKLVRNEIAVFCSKEPFKDVKSLVHESNHLNSFEFKTVTVNHKGRIIKEETRLAEYFSEDLGNGITLEMVYIPEGSFLMGSPANEPERLSSESPQRQVTVRAFFMGKYAVTQAQWQAVAALPQVNRKLKPDPSHFKGADRPVEKVSWYDAVEFCDRLSQYTGRPYILPSEAEWEYACRAGTTTPFHFGETITSELANYNAGNAGYTYGAGVKGTYREETTPVSSFNAANAFGLYDMHGNVWEWCLDDWHDNYEGAPTDGSAWLNNNNLSQKQEYALLRGGSWLNYPEYCRSASRDYSNRDVDSINVGFRVVCAVGRILR